MSFGKLFPWNEASREEKKVLIGLPLLVALMFVGGIVAPPDRPFVQRCMSFGMVYFLLTVFMTVVLSRMHHEAFSRCAWKVMAVISLSILAVLAYGFASHFHWF